jgi:endonuclease/exonuclease/phosphatase family metal-dependent hydrolase
MVAARGPIARLPPSVFGYLSGMELRVLSWNLFHGRDRAPDPKLHTWRSRLTRRTERGGGYAQVNRDLYEQFSELLAIAEWDIALLQECPPRWAESLAVDTRAHCHRVLTARNLPRLGTLQGLVARANPDLIASWEGGSNVTMVRTPDPRENAIVNRRELTLARSPETRRMAFSRLCSGICVANLHASEAQPAAEREVWTAAATAVEWAEGSPLIFGGDLNLRPATSPTLFARLADELGLEGTTGEDVIDHLLSRGLERIGPAERWEPARREVPDPTAGEGADGPWASEPAAALPVRLSDHAPVEVRLLLPGQG